MRALHNVVSCGLVVGIAWLPILILTTTSSSQNIADLVDRARPSVAFVLSQGEGQAASGSAFVVDPDGLLVTALHVVATARTVSVLLPGGSPQTADVVAADVPDDLAVLHIPQGGLAALPLGDVGSNLRVGQDIIAVGYPVATMLSPTAVTVTRGIVSAIRPPFIQVDAALNPGNSGGPVLDTNGNVVGVADWKVVMTAVQGLNFAVSSDAVKPLVARARGPSRAAFPLPLTTTKEVALAYISGGIGNKRVDKLEASCISPPAHAEALIAWRGTLQAPREFMQSANAISVVTWLSLDGGAGLGNPGTFGYLAHNAPVALPANMDRGEVSVPTSVCLNYVAIKATFPLVGLTFKATYQLTFRVWSPAIAP